MNGVDVELIKEFFFWVFIVVTCIGTAILMGWKRRW